MNQRMLEKILIIAFRFIVLRLMFFAKVTTARFIAIERVDAHQLGKLQKIGNAASYELD